MRIDVPRGALSDVMRPARRLQRVLAGLFLVCLIGLQGVVAHHSVAHAFEDGATAMLADGEPDPAEPAAAHVLCALCTLGTHLADALPAPAPVMEDASATAVQQSPYGLAGADRNAPTPLNRGPPGA